MKPKNKVSLHFLHFTAGQPVNIPIAFEIDAGKSTDDAVEIAFQKLKEHLHPKPQPIKRHD